MKFVPVIISGGAGSRLWPLSREMCPKPFVELPDGTTLIGRTYLRVSKLEGVERIVTVTNRELMFLTSDAYQATAAADTASTFLLEPFGRDTAAAVGLAAAHVASVLGEDAVLLILPADHMIRDEEAFAAAVKRATGLARRGDIVTFGIEPNRPETGFGYIETDGERALRFVEKPDAATAAAYLASGRYRWNSGMFCFCAGTMLRTMQEHCPEVLSSAQCALEGAPVEGNGKYQTVDIAPEPFARAPAISIDYAVMEKADNVACVSVDCGWSDIGSWSEAIQLVAPDDAGNRVVGDVVVDEATDCFVHAQTRLVSLIGVSDLIVVDTPDALLVADKNKTQNVKAVYNQLKTANHDVVRLHRTVHRPWGTYTVLEEGDRFKIKRIEVKPGGRLSLQAHHHRSEHWVVVYGTARVTNGDDVSLLSTNESTYIPSGCKHRLENPGILPLVLIEVQSGDYLGEDDIVRFEDVYGRP